MVPYVLMPCISACLFAFIPTVRSAGIAAVFPLAAIGLGLSRFVWGSSWGIPVLVNYCVQVCCERLLLFACIAGPGLRPVRYWSPGALSHANF